MQVNVNGDKCAGHARCAIYAPDVFILNDDGYMDGGLIDVPEGSEDAARRGVRACPERALEIVEASKSGDECGED